MTRPASAHLTAHLQRLNAVAVPFKARLAQRLSDLAVVYSEDYEGRTLDSVSVDAFLTFLELSLPPRYPDVTATPVGNIYAEWRSDNGSSLSIEFLADGDVRFLLLRPNPRQTQRFDRVSGLTTADALLETITRLASLTGFAAWELAA